MAGNVLLSVFYRNTLLLLIRRPFFVSIIYSCLIKIRSSRARGRDTHTHTVTGALRFVQSSAKRSVYACNNKLWRKHKSARFKKKKTFLSASKCKKIYTLWYSRKWKTRVFACIIYYKHWKKHWRLFFSPHPPSNLSISPLAFPFSKCLRSTTQVLNLRLIRHLTSSTHTRTHANTHTHTLAVFISLFSPQLTISFFPSPRTFYPRTFIFDILSRYTASDFRPSS